MTVEQSCCPYPPKQHGSSSSSTQTNSHMQYDSFSFDDSTLLYEEAAALKDSIKRITSEYNYLNAIITQLVTCMNNVESKVDFLFNNSPKVFAPPHHPLVSESWDDEVAMNDWAPPTSSPTPCSLILLASDNSSMNYANTRSHLNFSDIMDMQRSLGSALSNVTANLDCILSCLSVPSNLPSSSQGQQ
ncbi:hypothetical protein RclHR1_08240023 [Rhizophagus clarus]|uniref:Uncharacterized protein n=1 Tax=Rhizophagus clarus TaxID=94130 RepID=A0A2Z6S6S1_9GLOM|nr:hypothetical protein RclHR1_08240023 [Rhizophagus clarus]GET01233.1 hypothetical protein RCL_jg18952.t1 [Rhizophagus clarus]